MQLEEFCRCFESVASTGEIPLILREGRALLAELLAATEWFELFLQRIATDAAFRGQQKPSRWPNEYTVHRSPAGNFVILAYIWEPHQVDVVHDHNSWGVIGTLAGKVAERKYRRLDDGSRDGCAELTEISHRLIPPGATSTVLPLDGGIHRMENRTHCSISINVYGKSYRKGYINYYDVENRTVTRAYIYPLYRAALALRALGCLDGPLARDILAQAARGAADELLQKEAELTLARLSPPAE